MDAVYFELSEILVKINGKYSVPAQILQVIIKY